MRFPKDTVAAIHDAAPYSTKIRWPAGAAEPQKNRVYWLQVEEEEKAAEEKAKRRSEYSPETHADVLAWMHFRRYGKWPEGYKPKKAKTARKRPDNVLLVLDVEILEQGWEATVAIYEDPDPIRHTGLKTKVPAGPNPIDGFHEVTEMESEQIIYWLSRREREELEDVLKFEHQASVDGKKIAEKERKVYELRRRGKRSILAEAAVDRAKKRAALNTADGSV
ncbi:MAG TPA: hypothetical protein VEW07_02245 [Solirubrobacterales bacterium]|nr:hypothetical protein [Solirubrobacterales bacterium]